MAHPADPSRSIAALRSEELASIGPKVKIVAPNVQDYASSFKYGQIWERQVLSERERSLVVVASLVTLSCAEELRLHVLRALANGITKEEVGEIFTQLVPYIGFPLVVSAAASVSDLIEKAGADD